MIGTLKNFFLQNKKALAEVAICKFFEGVAILAASFFLVRFEIILFFAATAARFLISATCAKKILKLSTKFQNSIRKNLHAEIFNQEISSGEILTLTFDTVQTLDEFFIKVLPNIFSTVILLPLFLISALFTDWLTAIILLVTLPISPLLLFLIGKATAEKNSRAWLELQNLNSKFKEILSAITTLKMFGRIDAAAQILKSTSKKSSLATLEVLKLAFVSSFALELITTLSIALVAVTLGLRLIAGGVEFEAALFLLLIAPEFFAPLRKLGIMFHVVISAKMSIERLQKFFCTESAKFSAIEKLRLPPEISVENVSYIYPQKNFSALENLTLKIPAGKITAIVGESGAGKSTLLKLLAGLILPTRGEIFFNELPTSKFQRESLFKKIAYMPQAPKLFDATLAENFSMFNQLETSELEKFLSALNLQLDLSAAKKISRGQLQRLGLIRALLKNSSLIILDEPTAGLDFATEEKVLALLKKFSSRRTIIIATHRQAVIDFAENVIEI